MKRTFVILLVTGAVFTALSFLFAGIDQTAVQNIRWTMFVFGLVLTVVSAAVLIITLRRAPKVKLIPEGADYRKKRSLMSAPEITLYRTLCEILMNSRYAVFPQTALVSVIDKISGGGFRTELFRVADFCIADARTFEPLLLVELNDASHKRDERKLRDDKVNAICENAGIPVLTLSLDDGAGRIRSLLKKYL